MIDVIYEDNHLLVLNKPAGIVTMGDPSRPTLHGAACDYLKRKYDKPGNVYLGIVSRLDTVTSGVIVMARTSKSAARLSDQFAGRGKQRPQKIYLAALPGHFKDTQGSWVDFVIKDEAAHRMRVVESSTSTSSPSKSGTSQAQRAVLDYIKIAETDEESILAIQLQTGRKHQIRVQASHRGLALIGDRKYGSRRTFADGIALHSWKICIEHPTRRESQWFDAQPPRAWRGLLRRAPDLEKVWDAVHDQFA